jgi:hypothetical protein
VADIWALITTTETPWWAVPATALITLWLTARSADHTRHQQAAVDAVGSVAALAVHVAALLHERGSALDQARAQRAVSSDPAESPEVRQQAAQRVAEWEQRAHDSGTQIAELQRDFYQAQSQVNLLVPGVEQEMIRLGDTLESMLPAAPDQASVHAAADEFLSEARAVLRIRGGSPRRIKRRAK